MSNEDSANIDGSSINIHICDDSKIHKELNTISESLIIGEKKNSRGTRSLPLERVDKFDNRGNVYDLNKNRMMKRNIELEDKLNAIRKQVGKKDKMYYELGLTPRNEDSDDTELPHFKNEPLDKEEQMLERKEELGFRRNTFWKSCCGAVIDRRAIQFFVQVSIGAGVMMFCMAKIWQAVPLHGCTGEDTTVYFSLLSALVGFYIPSPSMNRR